jgi:hypothetical protein
MSEYSRFMSQTSGRELGGWSCSDSLEQSAPSLLVLNLAVRDQEAVKDAPSVFRTVA